MPRLSYQYHQEIPALLISRALCRILPPAFPSRRRTRSLTRTALEESCLLLLFSLVRNTLESLNEPFNKMSINQYPDP
jgi:hypothetical protein